MMVAIEASLFRPRNHFTKRRYNGKDSAEKMPAKKMAIKNWRIIDKKSADIKKTSSSNTHLLIVSLFILQPPIMLFLGKTAAFLVPDFTPQQLAHFGFGQHVPKFDITGHFVCGQSFAAPLDEFRTAPTAGVLL